MTVQLDPAASTLSADPSFVSVDIDPSRATLVTDSNGNGSKPTTLTSSVIAIIVVGVVAVITGETLSFLFVRVWADRVPQQPHLHSIHIVAGSIDRMGGVRKRGHICLWP